MAALPNDDEFTRCKDFLSTLLYAVGFALSSMLRLRPTLKSLPTQPPLSRTAVRVLTPQG